MQTYIEPFHMKAMWFAFNMEYCYDSARDLVRVIPHILPPLIQLPAEEAARGMTIGWIGTMRINSSFTPNLGAAIPRTQTAQATIGVIINNDRAYPTPPVFIRFT